VGGQAGKEKTDDRDDVIGPTMPNVRVAIAACTAPRPSDLDLPEASSDITSVSAKAAHMAEIFSFLFARNVVGPKSSRSISTARASTSRNLPVPAAQRPLVAKDDSRPASSTATTALSLPPKSMTSLATGAIATAPRA